MPGKALASPVPGVPQAEQMLKAPEGLASGNHKVSTSDPVWLVRVTAPNAEPKVEALGQ